MDEHAQDFYEKYLGIKNIPAELEQNYRNWKFYFDRTGGGVLNVQVLLAIALFSNALPPIPVKVDRRSPVMAAVDAEIDAEEADEPVAKRGKPRKAVAVG